MTLTRVATGMVLLTTQLVVAGDGSDAVRVMSFNVRFDTPADGPNAWPLNRMESLLTTLVELDRVVKARGFEESSL